MSSGGGSRERKPSGSSRRPEGEKSRERRSSAEAPRAERDRGERSERRERREGEERSERREKREGEERRERRERREGENGEKEPRRRSQEGERRPEKSERPREADQEAWLDSLIADCNDNRPARDDGAAAAPPRDPREKMPKRPSSRADSRPKGDQATPARPEAAPAGERPRRKETEEERAKRKEKERAARAAEKAAAAKEERAQKPRQEGEAQKQPIRPPRPPAKEEVPLSEAVDDDIVEENHQSAVYNGSKALAGSAKFNASAAELEEEIEVNVSAVAEDKKFKAQDDIEEDIEYDDDFEEGGDEEEEEYVPQQRASPSPPPAISPPSEGSNKVTFRPSSSHSARAPSPPVGKEPAAEDIKKALQSENEKLARRRAPEAHDPRKKGFLPADYESTMPKFNLAAGSITNRAAYNRLQDLRKLKLTDKRTVESTNLFSQRPQSDLILFLAGKSLKYCKLKTSASQTGDDDVEIGVGTDEVWNEDKEMQFPTLTTGGGNNNKLTGDSAQLLPFLRRVLPLFESSMRETAGRSGMNATMQDGAVGCQVHCGLPMSFISGCVCNQVSVADLSICPSWYGADHIAALYTWPEASKPPSSSSTSLNSFMGPVRSIVGLHPALSSVGTSGSSSSFRPSRCLYSYCRLSSLTLVQGRPHLIVAGSEMGSLLVFDLRAKGRSPAELSSGPRGTNSAPKPPPPPPPPPSDENGVEGAPPPPPPPPSNSDPDLAHFEGSIWLASAFSTDIFAVSSGKTGPVSDDLFGGDFDMGGNAGEGVHTTEICCVRCSDISNGDSLIFALDYTGVVSFWRVLEFASVGIKLALQGSLSLSQGPHLSCLGGFLSASYLCIHPKQQAQFVTISTSGVRQANRQRAASSADGPLQLELMKHPEEALFEGDEFLMPGPFNTQPCGAAFNPFLPGLLLVAYAEGDLALFDSTICVPVVHWGNAVDKAPMCSISVAWSTSRPCVFFVKCGDSLDVWDLSQKSHLPVQTVNLSSGAPAPPTPPSGAGGGSLCTELFVGADGQPVVSQGGSVMVLGLPSTLTSPLQAIPPQHAVGEVAMEDLLMAGHEKAQAFPTLSKHTRAVEVPKYTVLERDLLRRILAGIHPMQAWI